MIQTTTDFIKYFDSIRRRTLNYVHVIPPDSLNWSPKDGEFDCADIIRHIIAAEVMFIRVATEGRWKYGGHKAKGEQSLDELITLLESTHVEAIEKLGQFTDQDLYEPRSGPKGEGHPLKAWRWLMAMTEHEIHHRSQLAVYLSLMGVQPPHIFGLGVEDLIAISVT